MDRRAVFFLCAAAVCAALAPLTEPEQQWLAIALAVLYALLAVASFADNRSQRKWMPKRNPPSDAE